MNPSSYPRPHVKHRTENIRFKDMNSKMLAHKYFCLAALLTCI